MSKIFVIAGPPGVGKSTSGFDFIDAELDILNEDEMAFKYRSQGYPDFREQAIHRFTQIIRGKLIKNADIALELNLGFPEHYDYILSAKNFSSENSLHIILFHTDDLELCLARARLRHESGRHLVKPETIREMYDNTLPLLQENFEHVDSIQFVHASAVGASLIAIYDRQANRLDLYNKDASWFYDDIYPFIANGRADYNQYDAGNSPAR